MDQTPIKTPWPETKPFVLRVLQSRGYLRVCVCVCVTYGLDQVEALPHQLLRVFAVGRVLGHGLQGGQDLRVQDPQTLGDRIQQSILLELF